LLRKVGGDEEAGKENVSRKEVKMHYSGDFWSRGYDRAE